MQINKGDLLHALEIVKPGISSKENIEQASSFAFMKDKVVSYNDEISISAPIKDLDIVGTVKANELYNLLHKLKKDEVEIEVVNESELQVKCGRAKAGLALQTEIKLPIEDIAVKGKWKSLPDEFLKGLEFAMGACSRDMSRPVLTCVHVNKEGFVEASDSFRIAKVTTGIEFPVKTALIPATSIVTIIKMQPDKIAEGNGWVHFKTQSGATISCRIFEDDQFPETSHLFKIKGTKLSFPKNIIQILDRASIFSKGSTILDQIVEITLDNGKFKIRSQSESGWFEEVVKIEYTGEQVSFIVTPYLLKDILSKTLTCIVAPDRLKFEGDNWIYISMLRKATKKEANKDEKPF